MVIETLGKKYTVIKYEYSDSHAGYFICRDEEGEKYTVVRVQDRAWILKTVEYLMEQMENSSFTDFVSCFPGGEHLYVVMKYAEGISLRDKLDNEECPLEERIFLGKGILDRILLSHMPDYFLQDCLHTDSIILSSGEDVFFRHPLRGLDGYGKFHYTHVQECLSRVFEELFAGELKRGMLPPAARFCSLLRQGEYEGILEVYTAYGRMCKTVRQMPPEEAARPRTWEFQAWERIKGFIRPFQKICVFLILLSAVVFFLYSVRISLQDGGEKQMFRSIGTLELRKEDTGSGK